MNWADELIQQFIFFTSILAGFSFSIVIQLLSFEEKKRITAVVISLITIAALSMMVSTFIGAILLIKLEPYSLVDQVPTETVQQIAKAALLLFYLLLIGLLTFLIGIGLSGWIWSRGLGILLSSFALIALGIMAWAIVVLLPA